MDAADVPLCADCVARQGLCARCRPSVVPQLKQPSWHRDAHSGLWSEAKEMSPEALRIQNRKRTAAARREAMRRKRAENRAALREAFMRQRENEALVAALLDGPVIHVEPTRAA